MNRFSWNWEMSDIKQDKPVKVFSTFSCGGGSSLGYKRAGFDVIGNVEIDPKINQAYLYNNKPKFNYLEDLREFNKREDLPAELYDLDILDGSPPCTTFSTAGLREQTWGKKKKFREGQTAQTLDDLFFVFLDTVEKLKPKIVVAENVVGLIGGKAKGYVNPIIVNKDGVILAGHTRLKALKDLGAESVECIVISHLTEEEEKAFRIADNRAAEFAQWDSDLLVSEMKEINADDWEKYGFKGNDIKKLLPPEMCKCPKCGKSFYKA